MNAITVRRIIFIATDAWRLQGAKGADESMAKMVAKVMDKVVVGGRGGIFHAATSRYLTNTRQKALR